MHADLRPLLLLLLLGGLVCASAPDVACAASDVAAKLNAATPPADALAQCKTLGLSTCPEPFDAILPDPKDMLTWDQSIRVVGFRNTYRQYQADVFHTFGAKPLPLPRAPGQLPGVRYAMDGHTFVIDDYLKHEQVKGLLILKNGRIAYEYYGGGNTEKTLWTSRSVAKSVVSILVGMAIKEGFIASVDDPIVRYLPELKGTAWNDVTLRVLLQHGSGVAWNEHYADPNSDFAHLTRCEAESQPYPCVMQLVSSLPRRPGVKPGDVWSYNTGGAWLVGRVLEQATGMNIAHYLETRLWSRLAMEQDGVWEALLPGKVDMGGHGFNATLRDWGRFGLFVADGGKLADGADALPPGWITQSVTWSKARGSVTSATPDGQYGYQWWFDAPSPSRGATQATETAKHSFWAEGIYGQAIAVDPSQHLVMVQWSTWKEAETPEPLYDEQALFFDAVAHALAAR
jgi:CubicO group peptidase (beta-lactamase class C family)